MISSLSFVPRGAAQSRPARYEMSAAELLESKKLQEKLAEKERRQAGEVDNGLDKDGLPKELHMDDYGEDHDGLNWQSEATGNEEDGDLDEDEIATAEKMIAKAAKAAGEDDEEDEEMDQGDEEEQVDDDEEGEREQDEQLEDDLQLSDDSSLGSEADDVMIRPNDRLIVCAHTDEEFSNLEVYLYDEDEGSMFVHHDISLPAFPLCTEWVGCGRNVFGEQASTESRNYIAVGTFKPEIEIWNLDVLDALEPTIVLGGDGNGGKTPGAHSDAVMGLAWNTNHHHLFASGSADKSVKLWDLSRNCCVQTFKHHSDKVQCVAWNPVESSVLLTGSFDKSISVLDANQANGDKPNVLRIKLSADVESATWNPFQPNQVVACMEDGRVSAFDLRDASKPLYSFMAHPKKPCTSISFSPLVKGLFATCSADKTVRLWDAETLTPQGPLCVGNKNMESGALFDVSFDVSEPYLLGCGGDKGALALWDISEEHMIKQRFDSRISGVDKVAAKGGAGAAPPPLAPADTAETVDAPEGVGSDAAISKTKKKNKNKKKGK